MTDNELKELVKSLAVAQKKTDEQIASLFIAQKETDEQIASLFVTRKETDELMNKVGNKLDKVSELLGNIGHNQGDVAEEFFFNSLAKDIRFGIIHFDDISKNIHKERGKIQEEYDIVMTNEDAIGIVEVK